MLSTKPLLAKQEEIEDNTIARLSALTVESIPDDLIENAVQGALAALLARQEAMENNTLARLEGLKALVTSLASIVREMFQPNLNPKPPDLCPQSEPLSTTPSSPITPEHHPSEGYKL